MAESSNPVLILLVAITIAYLLGSLPLADRISRRNGVDIFSSGTGLPGASNVLKSVGRWSAVVVLAGDIAKAVVAVVVAQLLRIEGPWILLPAAAVIVGHWNSPFTGFRGGDGLSTLGGVVVALFPGFGLIAACVAILVALGGQKMPYTSLMGIVSGYATLVLLNLTTFGDMSVTLGLGGLTAMVLAHAIRGHKQRRSNDWADVAEASGVTE